MDNARSDSIRELKRRRWQYLQYLYDHAQAVPSGQIQSLAHDQVVTALGFDEDEGSRISDYLAEAGLIELSSGGLVRMTVRGVDYVESALLDPESSTEHFPPVTTLSTDDMDDSPGRHGTVPPAQPTVIGVGEAGRIRELVALAREEAENVASPVRSAEIEADLTTVESQLRSPEPKASVLRECLSSVRTTLQDVGAPGAAATQITEFLRGWEKT